MIIRKDTSPSQPVMIERSTSALAVLAEFCLDKTHCLVVSGNGELGRSLDADDTGSARLLGNLALDGQRQDTDHGRSKPDLCEPTTAGLLQRRPCVAIRPACSRSRDGVRSAGEQELKSTGRHDEREVGEKNQTSCQTSR